MLPTLPSALIRVALKDLKTCEEDDNYRINMSRWHASDQNGFCEVCMAGAVMAQTIGTDITTHQGPRGFDDAVLRDTFYAINLFRVGYIEDALACLKCPAVMEDRVDTVHYMDDRELFFTQMNSIADDLEVLGQ